MGWSDGGGIAGHVISNIYIPYSLLFRRMCLYHHRKKVCAYNQV